MLLDAGTDVNAQFITNPGISLDYSINKSTGVYLIFYVFLLFFFVFCFLFFFEKN